MKISLTVFNVTIRCLTFYWTTPLATANVAQWDVTVLAKAYNLLQYLSCSVERLNKRITC